MFRRRRQRRQFSALITTELQRVRDPVREHLAAADGEIVATLDSLREGSTAACPECSGRMRLGPVKVQGNWWTLWACSACGKMVRDADLPVENRPGGVRF